MADPAGRVARSGSPLSIPRRSGRVVSASSKMSTALNTVEKVAAEANEINERDAPSESVESEVEPGQSRKARSNGETGRNMFQKLEKSYEEMGDPKEEAKELKQKVTEQTLAIGKQYELIGNLYPFRCFSSGPDEAQSVP